MKLSSQTPKSERRPGDTPDSQSQESGYILLTLLLVVTLLIVGFAVILPTVSFNIRRDREQELIHRGVQYTRAIRAYYKKFGRYPTRIEDLENTNNLRFLRKRYKDPVTGQDFKLLHFGEPGVTLTGSVGGGVIPGATPAGAAMNGSAPSSSGFGGSAFGGSAFGGSGSSGSAFGGSGSGGSAFGGPGSGGSAFGGSGVNSSGVFSQSSGPGGNSNGGFGANSNSSSQTPSDQQTTTPPSGSDSSQTSSSQTSSTGSSTGQTATGSNGQVIGGGPIVGVASTSKKDSIREFNHKKKYSDWQFVYDPSTDRGGLIRTPNQPPLQGFMQNQPGQNGQPGSTNSSPFGSPTGFGNNANPMGGPTTPAQPPSNPPQQQPQ